MPLMQESHDSLPFIDGDISAETRQIIHDFITAEISPDHATSLHPSIPTFPEPNFSPLIQVELDRLGAGEKRTGGIDLSRYEAIDPPETDPTSDETRPETLQKWRDTLRQAYTSSSYLSGRLTNLALLETYGKNAWLIGNSQLEDILKGLEKERAEAKEQLQQLEEERRREQGGVQGELVGLEEGWKRGVRRMIETEAAAEGLRREILERRRQGAA